MHNKRYKTILSPQNGMNLYRGCTHGCIYCDSRSRCYQMQHDFEDIEVKSDAAQLLRAELAKKRKKCMIGTGAMSDPYLPLEETLLQTRQCLQVIAEMGFGLAIQTKSCRILRDLDLLTQINRQTKCVVQMTLTTYDEDLCRLVEPAVSTTAQRAAALGVLRDAGIPTVVWLTPLLPFINDSEENLLGILNYCKEARVRGILTFGMGLTLREGNREFFYKALDRHFPGLKQRYISTFGNAYSCQSPNETALKQALYQFCRENNILCKPQEIFSYLQTFPQAPNPQQLSLF